MAPQCRNMLKFLIFVMNCTSLNAFFVSHLPYLAYPPAIIPPQVASPSAIILRRFAHPTAIIESQLANSSAIIHVLYGLE